MFVSWANIYFHSAAIGQKFRGGTMLPTMNETCIQGSEGLSLWTSFVRRNVLTWDLIQQGSVKYTFFLFLQHSLSNRWFRRSKSLLFSWHALHYWSVSNHLWASRMRCDGARETAVYQRSMRQKTHETGGDNRRTNENITVCLQPLGSLNIRLHGVVITSLDRSLPCCLFESFYFFWTIVFFFHLLCIYVCDQWNGDNHSR